MAKLINIFLSISFLIIPLAHAKIYYNEHGSPDYEKINDDLEQERWSSVKQLYI
jgi:hypothetical protein